MRKSPEKIDLLWERRLSEMVMSERCGWSLQTDETVKMTFLGQSVSLQMPKPGSPIHRIVPPSMAGRDAAGSTSPSLALFGPVKIIPF